MSLNLTQFDQLKADIQVYIKPIKDIVITDKESGELALSTAKDIKARLKKIEDLRKELKAPYKKAADEIDAYAKTLEALLKEPSDQINQKILNWNRELEKIRLAEVERIKKEERERQEAADKAAKEAFDLAQFEKEIGEAPENADLVVIAEYERVEAQAIKDVRSEIKKTEALTVKGVRLTWDFNIIDAQQIPRQFLVPDLVAIRKAIVDSKGEFQIAGIESFQKESMSFR